jgi:tetratricopeptide (TPR) repeat protein
MQGEDEFTFWHILVRDVAYAQIPRAQRAERHRKAAGWIERAAGERVGDHADILAHHYLRAIELGGTGSDGDAELRVAAGRYQYMAGERAAQLDGPRAAALYRQALELIGPDGALHADARLGLGMALFLMADQREAAVELEAAQEAFTERGELVRAASAMTVRALVLRNLDQMEMSRALLAEARGILEQEEPGVELLQVYSAMSGDAMLRSRHPESMKWSQQALDLAEALGRPDLQVRPLQFRGWARWDARDAEGAEEDLRASIELGNRIGEGSETAIGYNNYGGLRWTFEGPTAGLETYTEGMALAARRGMEVLRLWSMAESTNCLFDLGRWDEVLMVAEEVQAEARSRSVTQIASLAQPAAAHVLALRGSAAEAASMVSSGLPAAREVGDPQLVIPMLQAEGLVQARLGNQDRVTEVLLDVERITAETTGLIVSWSTDIVRLAVGTRDLDLARRLLEANPAMPGRSEHIVVTGRALIAEAEGRLDEALEGFRDAAERWAGYGHVIEHGNALIGVGRCLIALGRPAEAIEPLREARELFAAPGATVLVAEVDDLLAETAARAG